MGVQTITTPAGEEMVVMPRADYEALLAQRQEAFEEGADAAAFAAALANMRPEDVLPAEVTADILAGKGRVRAFREWRGLDQETLARDSAIPQEELMRIEAGEVLLSRDAAAALVLALDLPAGWLAV
jgi:ribosome-binding protein aMBF1 (putative translation factor)